MTEALNKERRIALMGNPNCGKTTLFNALCGKREYVGNWAGVTVEKKEGRLLRDRDTKIVDLPGLYSLSPYSPEEWVVLDVLLDAPPDLLINIVDGTNLERSLSLTLELLDLGLPLIVAVNMMDEVRATGGEIRCALLEKLLGVPVIPITARAGGGILKLWESIAAPPKENAHSAPYIAKEKLGAEGETIAAILYPYCKDARLRYFFTLRLLSGDEAAARYLRLPSGVRAKIARLAQELAQRRGQPDAAVSFCQARYQKIEELLALCARPGGVSARSQKIDRIATHRILCVPLFLAVVLLMFGCTFGPPGNALKAMMEHALEAFGTVLSQLLAAAEVPLWVHRLLHGAVLGGVGGVLAFLPQIAILFLFLSFLEDSGYLARAAFLMDAPLRRIGLSGKSFIPMLMGFGCTTPAVMAARTIESGRERALTVALVPFLSCSARLPIYALFAGVFFKGSETLCVFALYLFGALVTALCGALYKNTLFSGANAPFLLELPAYRLPTFSGTIGRAFRRCKSFVTKAGTVIFAMSVLVWLLQNITPALTLTGNPAYSLFAALGRGIAPVFAPLGFSGWRESCALLCGLAAKESVVSTLGVLYGGGTPLALQQAVAAAFSVRSGLSFMVFSLLYAPCLSAFVAICRELGSFWRGAVLMVLQTGIAYLAAFFVYWLSGFVLG